MQAKLLDSHQSLKNISMNYEYIKFLISGRVRIAKAKFGRAIQDLVEFIIDAMSCAGGNGGDGGDGSTGWTHPMESTDEGNWLHSEWSDNFKSKCSEIENMELVFSTAAQWGLDAILDTERCTAVDKLAAERRAFLQDLLQLMLAVRKASGASKLSNLCCIDVSKGVRFLDRALFQDYDGLLDRLFKSNSGSFPDNLTDLASRLSQHLGHTGMECLKSCLVTTRLNFATRCWCKYVSLFDAARDVRADADALAVTGFEDLEVVLPAAVKESPKDMHLAEAVSQIREMSKAYLMPMVCLAMKHEGRMQMPPVQHDDSSVASDDSDDWVSVTSAVTMIPIAACLVDISQIRKVLATMKAGTAPLEQFDSQLASRVRSFMDHLKLFDHVLQELLLTIKH